MASFQERGDTWFVQVRRKGFSKSKTFLKKSDAIKWARSIEAELDAEKYSPQAPKQTKANFGDLIDKYTEEVGGTRGFGRNKTTVLKNLKATLGHLSTEDMTKEKLIQYVSDRLKGGAGGVTVNIDLTYIKSVFKAASLLWDVKCDILAVDAAKRSMGVRQVTTRSKERTRRPTQSEIDKLIDYYRNKSRQEIPMWDIIPFAIATAMRLGEITRLKWSDLNEEHKTIIIRDRKHPREKHGNDQEVPLLGEAFDIVLRQPRTSDRIFPYSEDTISSIFPRAVQACAIDDLRFHDFRHEGVSRLFEKGYSIEQVSLISGHRDWSMLRRYTQLKARDLHKVFPVAA